MTANLVLVSTEVRDVVCPGSHHSGAWQARGLFATVIGGMWGDRFTEWLFFVYLSPTIMVRPHAWIFKCFIPSTEKLHGVVKLIYSVS